MKLQKIKMGFTLIELLVVITIIGILATGGVSVFTTQLQGARDTTRIKDLSLMKNAVYSYFSDESEYPAASTMTGDIAPFLSKQLVDPKAGDTLCWDSVITGKMECNGYYHVQDDDFGLSNSAFKLAINFEKKSNAQNKASDDGGVIDNYYEEFGGEGAQAIVIGYNGGSASGTLVY